MTCAASDNRFRESILKLFRNPHPEHGRDHLLARDARFQSECAVHSGAPDPEYDLDKTIGVRELDPVSTEQYFEWQNRSVSPQSANLSSLLCMGHMVGPVPAFVALLSESVASLNQNLVKREVSRSFTALERRAIAVLHRLVFQKPEAFYRLDAAASQSTLGMLCTGGTVANLTALWIARNSCFPPSEDIAGVEQAGLSASLARYGYDGAVWTDVRNDRCTRRFRTAFRRRAERGPVSPYSGAASLPRTTPLFCEDNRFLNSFNEVLQKTQSAAGKTYMSRTTVENTIHGMRTPIVALRAIIANPFIEERHMHTVLEDQALIGARLERSGNVVRPRIAAVRVS